MCPLPWHALLNTMLFNSIIFPLTLVQTRAQNANADVGGKKLVLVLNWAQVKHCIKKTCGTVDFHAPTVRLPPNGAPVWLGRKIHMPRSCCGWRKRKGPFKCIQFLFTRYARPFVIIKFSLYRTSYEGIQGEWGSAPRILIFGTRRSGWIGEEKFSFLSGIIPVVWS
jgi:hypothetical protein